MVKSRSIGFVSSTISECANETQFQFIISKEEKSNCEVSVLHQFDVVKVKRTLPQNPEDVLYAIVESIASISDAPDHVANYVSKNFGHPEKQNNSANEVMPRMEFYCVTARVLFCSGDNVFPVKTGDEVFLCESKEEIYRAMYANYNRKYKKYFPVAPLQLTSYSNKMPYLLLDIDSILGPDAAHLNVSGMSGVASKTTKALTILRSMFNRNKKVSVVIFNTKDKDLLDLHRKDNIREEDSTIYRIIDNLDRQRDWDTNLIVYRPGKTKVSKSQKNYILDFETQKKQNNLDLIIAGDLDSNGTMDSCVKALSEKENDVIFDSWYSLLENSNYFPGNGEKPKPLKKYGIRDESVRKFIRIATRLLSAPVESDANIFVKEDNKSDISVLVSDRLAQTHSVIVVDVAPLNPIQQAVVFGCVLRTVQRYCKEEGKKKKQRIAVFVDELNKYASNDIPQTNPILEMLIDVAETGRSMGLGLITAEQSLSVIHRRIKANIANHIIGRTTSWELNQPDYCMIPESNKRRISTFNHEDALVYTTYLNAEAVYAKFPDKFYKDS